MFLSTDVPEFDLQTGKRIGTSDSMEAFVSLRHQGTVWLHGTTRLHDGRIEADTIILHLAYERSLLDKELNGNGRCARVFNGVGQGLLKDAIESNFGGGSQAPFEFSGDANRHAGAFGN